MNYNLAKYASSWDYGIKAKHKNKFTKKKKKGKKK
jgi:hypothetical protein